MSAAHPCPDHAVNNGYPHVPIGTILDEIRKQNTGPRHVVILGAGMSGLVAAYELLKLGNTVEIIEASGGAGLYPAAIRPEGRCTSPASTARPTRAGCRAHSSPAFAPSCRS